MKYRIMINDAGRDGYSGFRDVESDTPAMAKHFARAVVPSGLKGVLVPLPITQSWTDPDSPPKSAELLAIPGALKVNG
jgi:hypothetical protein